MALNTVMKWDYKNPTPTIDIGPKKPAPTIDIEPKKPPL